MSALVSSGSETISMSGTPARLKSTPLLRSKWKFLPTSSSQFARVFPILGHVRAGELRLGNNLHERHTGAVEIDAAIAVEVEVLADVFLQVRPRDAHQIG